MPRHPVAWVLCVTGLHWALDGTASSWLAHATAREPALPGAALSFWVYQRLGAALLLSLPLLLLLYPDGRCAASTSTSTSTSTTVPLPAAFWSPLLRIAQAATPLSMLVPFAVVVRRYRTASGETRIRMRWLVWAAVVDALVMLSVWVLPTAWSSAGLTVAVGLTGIALAIGVARPHLVDIDRLLGGTLLYVALAATVVAVDVAVVAGTGALLRQQLAERDAALVALLVVMTVYGPLRHRLWLLIRRVALGRRDKPYRVVAGLAEQLERSDGPEEQLLAVTRTVAEAFRSPYVGVEVDRTGADRLLAEHGSRPAQVQTLPITYRGEEVGRLVLPRGGPRAALSTRDERLLGDVVRQAAAAARTSYLAAELQRSREQLVSAREEERRRLRRDLHDGLGPSLGAVALRIDTARNLSRSSAQDEADRVLRQAREDVTAALADVRRLVHDLRPPALDDVGLLGAVRQQAERLRTPGLTVSVDGGPGLDGLPAAVEVAAYRIASEALTNVARHAAARDCKVRIEAGSGRLVLEVIDDGVGIDPGVPAGVGLVSLRERAAELGGRCEVLSPDGRGTVVRAELPLGVGPLPLEVGA
jgi:signal transduction histidine kinase